MWPGGLIRFIEGRRREQAAGRAQAWIRTPHSLVADEEVSDTARFIGLFDVSNGVAVRAEPPSDVVFPNVELTPRSSGTPPVSGSAMTPQSPSARTAEDYPHRHSRPERTGRHRHPGTHRAPSALRAHQTYFVVTSEEGQNVGVSSPLQDKPGRGLAVIATAAFSSQSGAAVGSTGLRTLTPVGVVAGPSLSALC